MDKYYVYEYIRLDSCEPFYVGKGKGNRAYDLTRRNKHFKNICNKVPVAVHILHNDLNEVYALDLECWYIHQYKYVYGYDLCNVTDGGEGTACKMSDAQKKKISTAQLLKWQDEDYKKIRVKQIKEYSNTDEHKEKQRAITTANWKNPEYREKVLMNAKIGLSNKDVRQKMSLSRKKDWQRKEYLEFQQQKMKKLWENEDYRNKMKENNQNLWENNKNEMTLKIRNAVGKKIVLINTGQVYDCIVDAYKAVGLSSSSHIVSCCKGKRKSAGKINGESARWMYYEDYLKLNNKKEIVK